MIFDFSKSTEISYLLKKSQKSFKLSSFKSNKRIKILKNDLSKSWIKKNENFNSNEKNYPLKKFSGNSIYDESSSKSEILNFFHEINNSKKFHNNLLKIKSKYFKSLLKILNSNIEMESENIQKQLNGFNNSEKYFDIRVIKYKYLF